MKKIIVLMLLFVMLCAPQKANAGFFRGDESLMGVSYLFDCAYYHRKPDAKHMRILEIAEANHKDYLEVSDKEYEILCRIVEAEATGGDVKQKANVASCVLARVESKEWKNTIEGVVFEHYGNVWQFTPISDGRYYTVKITESTKKAVDQVLHFGKTHDCTWFCSDKSYKKENSYHRKNHTWVFYDGEHHYFYD